MPVSNLRTCPQNLVLLCDFIKLLVTPADFTAQSHVSHHLLHKLQESNDDLFWDDHPDLLMWILYTGGSFSPKGPTRSGFKALLQINHTLRFKAKRISLSELLEILIQFVWSERMYRAQVEEFWEEIHTET
jgi:hypothetical protein